MPVLLAALFEILTGGTITAEAGVTTAEITAAVRILLAVIQESKAIELARSMLLLARMGTFTFVKMEGKLFLRCSWTAAGGRVASQNLPLFRGVAFQDVTRFINAVSRGMANISAEQRSSQYFNACIDAMRQLRNYAASGGGL